LIFQAILISSGNLAWLNWLTLLMCVPCFDDEALTWIGIQLRSVVPKISYARILSLISFTAVILLLSISPTLNLVSSDQAMNTSYSSWHLVNSYGAFGSVGKERGEVILEGTSDPVVTEKTVWKEYEFPCAPGDETRRPCWIGPYHYHLDWQIWFSGMRSGLQEEWLFRMVVRLLEGDKPVTELFEKNPFPEQPPKWLRMELYRYHFADWKDWPSKWWRRELMVEYMPPVSLETPLATKFRSDLIKK
jgi:hypothetical protein